MDIPTNYNPDCPINSSVSSSEKLASYNHTPSAEISSNLSIACTDETSPQQSPSPNTLHLKRLPCSEISPSPCLTDRPMLTKRPRTDLSILVDPKDPGEKLSGRKNRSSPSASVKTPRFFWTQDATLDLLKMIGQIRSDYDKTRLSTPGFSPWNKFFKCNQHRKDEYESLKHLSFDTLDRRYKALMVAYNKCANEALIKHESEDGTHPNSVNIHILQQHGISTEVYARLDELHAQHASPKTWRAKSFESIRSPISLPNMTANGTSDGFKNTLQMLNLVATNSSSSAQVDKSASQTRQEISLESSVVRTNPSNNSSNPSSPSKPINEILECSIRELLGIIQTNIEERKQELKRRADERKIRREQQPLSPQDHADHHRTDNYRPERSEFWAERAEERALVMDLLMIKMMCQVAGVNPNLNIPVPTNNPDT